MNRNTRENLVQVVGLTVALAGGYLIWGWGGVLLGFLLFTVAIVVRVRFKMGKAQRIGTERTLALRAASGGCR